MSGTGWETSGSADYYCYADRGNLIVEGGLEVSTEIDTESSGGLYVDSIGTAEAWAYVSWTGAPAVSTPVIASIDLYATGHVSAEGTAYAQINQASAGGGSSAYAYNSARAGSYTPYGYSSASGSAADHANGSASLTSATPLSGYPIYGMAGGTTGYYNTSSSAYTIDTSGEYTIPAGTTSFYASCVSEAEAVSYSNITITGGVAHVVTKAKADCEASMHVYLVYPL